MKAKYVVLWMDHICCCVVELSSSHKNAEKVSEIASKETPVGCRVLKMKEWEKLERELRNCKDENWEDFMTSKEALKNAEVDFYLKNWDRKYDFDLRAEANFLCVDTQRHVIFKDQAD